MSEELSELSPLECATEITVAWLSNPNTRASAEDVPVFLQNMHSAVLMLNSGAEAQQKSEPASEYAPAVTARKSLSSPDHIISLIDGKPYKTLKRHLSTHGLTPAEYRARYGLKSDYPMVAPTYAATRRELAKSIGLGRKPGQKSINVGVIAEEVPLAPAAEPVVVAIVKGAAKPKAATKAKAAPMRIAAPEPAAVGEPAADGKAARRKKL
ncbi:MAG: transcriptional regulator, partial [Novosphingobium sp.]|nr:transcriptional regulator [Novosphingobium sp.]